MNYELDVQNLIKYVMKMFYGPQHVAFMNILLKNILLTDDEACKLMKLLNREFNKIVMKLKEDRLIKTEQKLNSREIGKDTIHTVYYINYAEARDVIKYKITKMFKTIEKNEEVEEDEFYCKRCIKTYTVLEAQAHIDKFIFKCAQCGDELVENKHKIDKDAIDNKSFIEKMGKLISLLKKADQHKIENMEYFQIQEYKKQRDEENKKEIEQNTKIENDVNRERVEIVEEFDDVSENVSVEEQKDFECVLVDGVQKRFDLIEDEDIERMNEEEYVKYCEMHEKYK